MADEDGSSGFSPVQRGVEPVLPGQNPGLQALECRSIAPSVREWLPEVLERLLPRSADRVRGAIVDDLGDQVLEDKRPGLWPQSVLVEQHGVDALARSYADGLTKYALQYAGVDERQLTERQSKIREYLTQNLTELGTGRGILNAGVEAVLDGPVALHRALDERPTVIRLTPDPAAWADADYAVLKRSLRALSVLAQGFRVQIRLPSPQLRRRLKRSFPAWYAEHLAVDDLSEQRGTSPTDRHATASEQPGATDAPIEADELLDLHARHSEDGKHRLLAALSQSDPRQVRALKSDDDVDAGASTVDAYLSALEADALVAIERRSGRSQSNRVTLTARGAAFVALCQVDGAPRHPEQTGLSPRSSGDLSAPPHRDPSTVYPARQGREGGEDPSDGGAAAVADPAEAALATTGDPDEHGRWVQWLRGPDGRDGRRDAWWMHERYAAGRRTPGVTLVDDRVERFEDARVVKASCFDDELQLHVEWGRSLPTLGRLAAALMSPRVVTKILGPEATGDEFERLYDGALANLQEDLGDWMRWGAQIGWFSEDEEEWPDWRDRFGEVRSLLLEKLGELVESDDVDAREELYRDLHGFIASMTQLYYAVGVDVTFHIRTPDTFKLVEQDERFEDFIDFFRYLMPKQTVYNVDGVHSGYRMLLEQRERKLKQRMSYDVRPDHPAMHLTASVVVSGPTATEFRDAIEDAIEAERQVLREAVRDGDEPAPAMEIPVVDGTAYGAIKQVLRRFVSRKDYQIAETDSLATRRDGAHEERRLVRLLLTAFATEDAPGRASPYSVAEALLALAQSSRVDDYLSTRDLAYGLSQVPARRLMPSLTPNQRKILRALLASDEPIGRSEAIDRAGISGSRWHQHIKELAALDVVERVEIDGRAAWTAHIEPWWAPERSRTAPFDAAQGISAGGRGDVDAAELLFELYCAVDDVPVIEDAHELFAQPLDVEAIHAEHAVFRRWWPIVLLSSVSLDALDEVGDERHAGRPPPTPEGTAVIGERPEGADPDQTTLDAWSAAASTGTIIATDGGRNRQPAADDGSR